MKIEKVECVGNNNFVVTVNGVTCNITLGYSQVFCEYRIANCEPSIKLTLEERLIVVCECLMSLDVECWANFNCNVSEVLARYSVSGKVQEWDVETLIEVGMALGVCVGSDRTKSEWNVILFLERNNLIFDYDTNTYVVK